jgi:hypothetical protein
MGANKVIVRFIDSRGFVGGSISRLTGSLFSHTEFGTPDGTWIGAHAGSGIQERPAGYCNPKREYVYEIPCTEAQEKALFTWAWSKIGTKYNYADIAGLLFQARGMTSPSRMICSEFVTEGLLRTFGAAKVLNVLEQWDYRITPETLHLSPIFVGKLKKKVG